MKATVLCAKFSSPYSEPPIECEKWGNEIEPMLTDIVKPA